MLFYFVFTLLRNFGNFAKGSSKIKESDVPSLKVPAAFCCDVFVLTQGRDRIRLVLTFGALMLAR